jgi:hypothetical protein
VKHRLYLKNALQFDQLAEEINRVALRGFTRTLRDGLNRGGGDYFSFVSDNAEVLLVHNDTKHPDMYVPRRAAFPYYCYLWAGQDSVLEAAEASIRNHGIECALEAVA